jgi:hypothetical protein
MAWGARASQAVARNGRRDYLARRRRTAACPHRAFHVSAARRATRARLAALAAHGRGRDRALERRLGELVPAATR